MIQKLQPSAEGSRVEPLSLFGADVKQARQADESRYLTSQLITCIGNKRALLSPIRAAVETARARIGGADLRILDAFSGSGAVARMLKSYASELVVNDIEDYATAISRCFLANRSEVDLEALDAELQATERIVSGGDGPRGFIRELYAPRDAEDIRAGERVFYTPENAYRLDAYRQLIGRLPPDERDLLLGPLLSAASVHANTAGVFKGFYKDRATGVGKYGGTGSDALSRIMRRIVLEAPVLSPHECHVDVRQGDANHLAGEIGDVDIAYLDPPYNQHPYGSNYFMLNLLTTYRRPEEMSPVSGIPTDWRRSDFNVRRRALPSLLSLVGALRARFVILSFNDDGFIDPAELRGELAGFGEVFECRRAYATFRGSRNLSGRSAQVTEHVYLVDKR